jgi:hypothetical protein
VLQKRLNLLANLNAYNWRTSFLVAIIWNNECNLVHRCDYGQSTGGRSVRSWYPKLPACSCSSFMWLDSTTARAGSCRTVRKPTVCNKLLVRRPGGCRLPVVCYTAVIITDGIWQVTRVRRGPLVYWYSHDGRLALHKTQCVPAPLSGLE